MTCLLTFMAKKKTTPKKPKAKNGSQLPAQAIPFEQSLEDLKVIVSELEAGQLTLGDSLEKYEIGIKHLKKCYQALEKAEQKIKVLVRLDADGSLQTESFDGRPTEFDAGQPAHDDSAAEEGEEYTEEQPEEESEFGEDFYDDTEDIDDAESLF